MTGQISLYSSYSPSLRTWVLQPSPESLSDVLGVILQKLPGHRPLMLPPIVLPSHADPWDDSSGPWCVYYRQSGACCKAYHGMDICFSGISPGFFPRQQSDDVLTAAANTAEQKAETT